MTIELWLIGFFMCLSIFQCFLLWEQDGRIEELENYIDHILWCEGFGDV